MSSAQLVLEYLLVYCKSHGLTAIGEPPLPKTYRPVGDPLGQTQHTSIWDRRSAKDETASDSKIAMPVRIVFIFLTLATAKKLLLFMVSYAALARYHSLIFYPRFGICIKLSQQSSWSRLSKSIPWQPQTPKVILTPSWRASRNSSGNPCHKSLQD